MAIIQYFLHHPSLRLELLRENNIVATAHMKIVHDISVVTLIPSSYIFYKFKFKFKYVNRKYDFMICGVWGSDLLRSDTKMADHFRVTADR